MSDTILEFGLFQDMIFPTEEINPKQFREFCQNIDDLETLIDPEIYVEVINYPDIYVESLTDNRKSRDGRFKDTVNNTIKTTKDAANIFDQATEGNSRVIKGLWDLLVAASSLALKILNFVLNNISKIPTLVANTLNKISNLPESIVNRIKGKFEIYITAGDIGSIYTKVIPCIQNFCDTANVMTKNKFWSTFWKPRVSNIGINGKKEIFAENDMELGRKVRKIYRDIQLLEFHPSTIEITNETRDIYFKANGTKISFSDLSGKTHKLTYLEGIKILATDLESLKTPLSDLKKMLGEKYEDTKINQTFVTLSAKAQREVTETIQCVSKVITVVGNLIRYTQTDMTTIQKAAIKLAKRDEEERKKTASKKQQPTPEGTQQLPNKPTKTS